MAITTSRTAIVGTAPLTAQNLSTKAMATDTSALSAPETLNTTALGAPSVTGAAQTWTDGQNADVVLPGKAFTDALGLKMTFAAYEVAGPNVTSWLHFNPTTDELFGKVPANASGTAWLAVVASDAQHMSFPVTFVAGSTHVTPGGATSMGMTASVEPSHPTNVSLFHS